MKQVIKKVFSTILAVSLLPTAYASTQNIAIMSANAAVINEKGVQDGYDWELYNYDNLGTAKMHLNGNGAFTAEWNDTEIYNAKSGKIWFDSLIDSNGDFSIEYDIDFRPNGNAYVAGYGWTDANSKGYLIEYFIVENYGTWRPTGKNDYIDSIEVDGHIYDVYKDLYFVDGGIWGYYYTILQYYSVRRDEDRRSEGTINVSKHFEEWKKLGLDLGENLKEISLLISGCRSSGYAEVKKNDITINGVPINNENDIIPNEIITTDATQITLAGDANCDGAVDVAVYTI